MDRQDMKQTGLAGEFLAENEPTAPNETQQTIQAVGVSGGPSSARESANAQKLANTVLAVLFLAGMSVVYFMSMQTEAAKDDPLAAARETIVNDAVRQFQISPTVVSDDPQQADQPERSPVELAREMIEGTPDRQIPLKQLKDNPFILKPDEQTREIQPKAPKTVGITPGVSALQKAQQLELQSIVTANNRSLAIISDRLIAVGQEIVGWRVHEIGNGQVTLKLNDLSYILRVKQ